MDLSPPLRKPRAESIVPMINVVFLLLIFFLMTSQIAPPDPLEVTAPTVREGSDAQAKVVLYVDSTGRMHVDGAEDAAALPRLQALSATETEILMRADATLEAARLAEILKELAQIGLTQVELAVIPQ